MHRIIGIACSASLAAALAAGCGRGALPSRPAALQGTVRTANGSAAPGILAALDRSNLSASTDDAGRFSIEGAAEGPATLRLTAQGVDASVAVPRLGKDLVVRVSVRLTSDGKGELEGEPEAELTGAIASISGTDLVVSGQTVHTDAQTSFRVGGAEAGLAQLRPGQQVEVEGIQQADGSILAREIKTEDAEGGLDDEIELSGSVEAISGADLTVSGRIVHTDAATVVDGNGASRVSDLQVGARVEVHAVLQSDGAALARRIHLED